MKLKKYYLSLEAINSRGETALYKVNFIQYFYIAGKTVQRIFF